MTDKVYINVLEYMFVFVCVCVCVHLPLVCVCVCVCMRTCMQKHMCTHVDGEAKVRNLQHWYKTAD